MRYNLGIEGLLISLQEQNIDKFEKERSNLRFQIVHCNHILWMCEDDTPKFTGHQFVRLFHIRVTLQMQPSWKVVPMRISWITWNWIGKNETEQFSSQIIKIHIKN